MKDYKKTLNLLTTDFEMKGNLTQKDLTYSQFWKDIDLYNKLSTRKGRKFILHDGPPYANGDIHMGHALNKILKDIIARYYAMDNYAIDFRCGWDTHGLPIELEIQKKKLTFSNKKEYLKECEKFALEQVTFQQQQFAKMNLLTNFNQKYLTLNKEYTLAQAEIFFILLNKDLIYQDFKPIYWSWSSKTALAESEIEYLDVEEDSIYVAFKMLNFDFNILIWTTTPWTLVANTGLALSNKYQYSLVKIDDEKYLIAKDIIKNLENLFSKQLKIIEENFEIDKIINKFAINPLNNNYSKIIYGHHINLSKGTGIVHIAGGHGLDDYYISKANNLEIIVGIDDLGKLVNADDLTNCFYLEANPKIINNLKNKCLFVEKINHSIPIDWRTKKPIVYRATKQWFITIKKIRNLLEEQLKTIKWIPKWGQEKLKQMIESREDWCISRQRVWGFPIPIIYDDNGLPLKNLELQRNIIKEFEKSGIDSWNDVDIEKIIPKNLKLDCTKLTKETATIDVWFDSGVSSNVLFKNNEFIDVVIEGIDQYRGWFNASISLSLLLKEKLNYGKILTHGFVNDLKGRKMSKSLGNVVNPLEIINKFGADILRLWVASNDYFDNLKLSYESFDQIVVDYRKIRNTIKFILTNIDDYEYDTNQKGFDLVTMIIASDLKEKINYLKECKQEFKFFKITKEIITLISSGSISFYLEYAKDILYTEESKSNIRKGVQHILFLVLTYIFIYLAPILPTTIEEAFNSKSYNLQNKQKSIFLQNFENIKIIDFGEKYYKWNIVNELLSIANKFVEEQKNQGVVKNNKQLQLKINLGNDFFGENKNIELENFLKNNDGWRLFLVSNITVFANDIKQAKTSFELGDTKLINECQRCRWYFNEKNFVKTKQLCHRCEKYYIETIV